MGGGRRLMGDGAGHRGGNGFACEVGVGVDGGTPHPKVRPVTAVKCHPSEGPQLQLVRSEQ